MGRRFLALLLTSAMHGGSCGNGCAHTGTAPSRSSASFHSVSPVSSAVAAHSVTPVTAVQGGHTISPVSTSVGSISAPGGSAPLAHGGTSVRPATVNSVAPPSTTVVATQQVTTSDVPGDVLNLLAVVGSSPVAFPMDAPLVIPCSNVFDCGDGILHQGAVCDRSMQNGNPQADGICRDACRDDGDCPDGFRCAFGLDPTDLRWGGCVER